MTPYLGTWHKPGEPYDASKVHDDIKYTKEDDEAIDNWIAGENSQRLPVI
jgi:alcohol oxidase